MVDSAVERSNASIISKLFLVITLSLIESLNNGEITYDLLFRYSVSSPRNFTTAVETCW